MISTSDFHNGLNFLWDGEPYTVIWFQHHKPGKGGAVMRVKLRNIHNGSIVEQTFKSGEKFQDITLEKVKVQYLYRDGDVFHLMNTATYEQIELRQDAVGENAHFLKEGMDLQLVMLEDKITGIELPTSVNLKVTYTEPGAKGDTVTHVMKSAKVETGAEIKVPLFVNTGDVVTVDTRTGEYVGRV
jgi:elongation factor P